MSQRHENRTERLAGEEAYSVDLCPCGCLHVHLGTITLRMSQVAFDRMISVMSEAAEALAAADSTARLLKH